MSKSMIALPTTNGWMVSWYTGEVKTIKYKNGREKTVRMCDSFTSASKEKVEAKKKQLEADGFEIEMFTESIF